MNQFDFMSAINSGMDEDFLAEQRRREAIELRYAITTLVMENNESRSADETLEDVRKLEEFIRGA